MEENKAIQEEEIITYKNMDFDYIHNWVKENGEREWLKTFWADYTAKHDGKEPPYVVIKRAFCEKFMSDLLPKTTKKNKKSMRDLIAAL